MMAMQTSCEHSICYTLTVSASPYFESKVRPMEGPVDTSSQGGLIRYYRLLRGLKQTELSAMVGCHRDTVWALENDRTRFPDVALLARIADALSIGKEVLLDDYQLFVLSDHADLIRRLRAAMGLTHAKFSELLGVSWRVANSWAHAEAVVPQREHFERLRPLLREHGIL